MLAVVLMFIIVIGALSWLYTEAPQHERKKVAYKQCNLHTYYELRGLVAPMNFTIQKCVSCDPNHDLALYVSEELSDGCAKNDILLTQCCVKVSYAKRDSSFDVIFGSIVAFFVFVFAGLAWYIEKDSTNQQNDKRLMASNSENILHNRADSWGSGASFLHDRADT